MMRIMLLTKRSSIRYIKKIISQRLIGVPHWGGSGITNKKRMKIATIRLEVRDILVFVSWFVYLGLAEGMIL